MRACFEDRHFPQSSHKKTSLGSLGRISPGSRFVFLMLLTLEMDSTTRTNMAAYYFMNDMENIFSNSMQIKLNTSTAE